MQIETHQIGEIKIAEVISQTFVINNEEEGLDLLGNIYFQGFDRLILHQKNIAPAFFDLKTRMAGEILQKFSNYRVKLAIVGDFKNLQQKSLRDFVFESNKQGQINFSSSLQEAIDKLVK